MKFVAHLYFARESMVHDIQYVSCTAQYFILRMEEGEVVESDDSGEEVLRCVLEVSHEPRTEAEAYLLSVRLETYQLPFSVDAEGEQCTRMAVPAAPFAPSLALSWATKCVHVLDSFPLPDQAENPEVAVRTVVGISKQFSEVTMNNHEMVRLGASDCAIESAEECSDMSSPPTGSTCAVASADSYGSAAVSNSQPNLLDEAYAKAIVALRSLTPGTLSFFQISSLRAAAMRFSHAQRPDADAIVAYIALRFGQRDLLVPDR